MDRRELEQAVAEGLSIAELASTFGRSKGSIRYWLDRYGMKTTNPTKRMPAPAVVAAKAAGLASMLHTCTRHGEVEFVREGRGYYRCSRCRVESVSRHRRKLKELLIAEAGGACVICGYARSRRALAFHHLDPSQKRFAVSARGVTLAVDDLRAEAQKCVLLCSNCHAEVEDGLTLLPIHCRAGIRLETQD
jgi:hypothetical protein